MTRPSARKIFLLKLIVGCVAGVGLLSASADDTPKPETKPSGSNRKATPHQKPEKSPEGKPENKTERKPGPEKTTPDKTAPEKSTSAKPRVTPSREAAAMTFARLHHPELAQLLDQLKQNNLKAYQNALQELFQESEKLERLREKQPERYEAAIELWKIESRIRLLAARMKMSADASLEDQMRDLLQQRIDLKLAQLREDHQRAMEKAEKMRQQIEQLESAQDEMIQKDLNRIRRDLGLEPATPQKVSKPDKEK